LQLAHSPRNAVSAAYNHALYLEPRARMMQVNQLFQFHLKQLALRLLRLSLQAHAFSPDYVADGGSFWDNYSTL
jgi:hypothetical protein